MSNITTAMKRRIKREMGEEKPTIWVGKNQVSPKLLEEIGRQLDDREIVKIKILKSAIREGKASELASMVAKQTNAILIEVRGHTFVLYKRRQRGLNR